MASALVLVVTGVGEVASVPVALGVAALLASTLLNVAYFAPIVVRAHVAGHSSGGAIALQLAVERPELVHTLALLEPSLAANAARDGDVDIHIRRNPL